MCTLATHHPYACFLTLIEVARTAQEASVSTGKAQKH
jgi:hypothetical protein